MAFQTMDERKRFMSKMLEVRIEALEQAASMMSKDDVRAARIQRSLEFLRVKLEENKQPEFTFKQQQQQCLASQESQKSNTNISPYCESNCTGSTSSDDGMEESLSNSADSMIISSKMNMGRSIMGTRIENMREMLAKEDLSLSARVDLSYRLSRLEGAKARRDKVLARRYTMSLDTEDIVDPACF